MGSVALFAADSADARHTAWWAWVLCGLLAIGCIAAGWFAFARSRATTDQGTRWFRLLCVHDRLWGEPSSRRISSDRLAGGLGLSLMDATLSTATVPTKPFGRGWLGDSSATLVGVPEHAAARMPFAASGCGVWALPAEAPPVGAQVSGLADQLSVPPAPGWFIGLTDAGESMLVHPIPGATFAVFGTSGQLRALEGSMNWPEELFDLHRLSGNAASANGMANPIGTAGAMGVADGLGATDSLAGDEGTKTQVLLVEVTVASRGPRNPRGPLSGSVDFAAAEDVLAQGRERLQLLGRPTVDVYIAVPPVGTGTILAHGEHREYFNFFAVTAPVPKPATQPAPKPAPQPVPQNAPVAAPATAPTVGAATPAPARSKRPKHRRARPNAHKHRFPHGAVSGPAASSASTAPAPADPLPLPTGERLARVVSARSASSSSAG